jgi:hypothetical protein
LEERDSVVRPGAVAGHRAVAKARQDRLGVSGNVVARPEVERPFHRLTIALSKERLDVLLEANRLMVADT